MYQNTTSVTNIVWVKNRVFFIDWLELFMNVTHANNDCKQIFIFIIFITSSYISYDKAFYQLLESTFELEDCILTHI